MLSLRYPGNPVLSKWSTLFGAVMESRIKNSTLRRRSTNLMSNRIHFLILDEMLYWAAQKGQYDTHTDLYGYRGAGGYIDRTMLH